MITPRTKLYMSSLFDMPELLEDLITKRAINLSSCGKEVSGNVGKMLMVNDQVMFNNRFRIRAIQSGAYQPEQMRIFYTIASITGSLTCRLRSPVDNSIIENVALENLILVPNTLAWHDNDVIHEWKPYNENLTALMNRCRNHSLTMRMSNIAVSCKTDAYSQMIHTQALYYEEIHHTATLIHDIILKLAHKRNLEYPVHVCVAALVEYMIMCFFLNAGSFRKSPYKSIISNGDSCEYETMGEYLDVLLDLVAEEIQNADTPNLWTIDNVFSLELKFIKERNPKLLSTKHLNGKMNISPILIHRTSNKPTAVEVSLDTIDKARQIISEVLNLLK